MATIDQLKEALVAAHEAGNTDDAYVLAEEIRKMQSAPIQNLQAKIPPSEPAKVEQRSFNPFDILQPIAAPVEVAGQMISGMGSSVLGGLRGIGSLVSGEGVDEAARKIIEVQQAGTYQPKTQLGQGLSTAVSYPFEKAREAGKYVGGGIGEFVGGERGRLAGESIGEITPDVAMTLIPGVKSIKDVRAKGLSATQRAAEKSFQDAARIEAAKLAVEKYGLSLDPVVSNPTQLNKFRATAVGQDYLNALIRKENEPKIAAILKEDLGIPKNDPLTSVAVFEKARAGYGQAKDQIVRIPSMVDNGGMTQLNIIALQPEALIGGKNAAKQSAKLIQEATDLISQPVTGARLITEIENMRKQAQIILKQDYIGPVKQAKADTYKGIANALEQMIDDNLAQMGRNDLLTQYRDGRVKMAKSYTLQNATDLNTGLVDASVLAKLTSKDNALTGTFSDIGKIAGNFPESLGMKPGAPGGVKEFATTHVTRTGIPGLVGYGVGSMFGMALPGAAVGAVTGNLISSAYGKHLARSPAAQYRVSVPPDYRGMLNPNIAPMPSNYGLMTLPNPATAGMMKQEE